MSDPQPIVHVAAAPTKAGRQGCEGCKATLHQRPREWPKDGPDYPFYEPGALVAVEGIVARALDADDPALAGAKACSGGPVPGHEPPELTAAERKALDALMPG